MLFSVLEFKILVTSLTKPSTTQFSKNIPVITKIQECSPNSRTDEEFCCLRKTASLPGPVFSVIMPGEDTVLRSSAGGKSPGGLHDVKLNLPELPGELTVL